ncbi:MAG: hypothetical protein JWO82_2512 [Akkermansiaceae bacterium]|nr:hypothetical protein [Akkermansiaceae bacterium]
MKTNQLQQTRVILKDGATYLAAWSQNFEAPPAIGDTISFPPHVGNLEHLESFRSRGKVNKVETGSDLKSFMVELEAEPRSGFRRGVVLNSGFVPNSLRMDAERRVRYALPDTRVIWEESMEPVAVLRISDSGNLPAGTLKDAQRSRSEAPLERQIRSVKTTLEAQLRQMLTRSREVLAHF